LSKDAQHALLKALEDTPSHVYFMLATTDPTKLLPTIKTRCVQFEVKALSDSEIESLLLLVSKKEQVKVPKEVIEQITMDSSGSPRMALSILDKVIGMEIKDMLSSAKQTAEETNEAIDLCRALIAKKSWKAIAPILKNIKQEPEQVRRCVLGYAQSVLLSSGNERAYLIIDAFRQPLYDIGKPGLVAACFEAIQ
jgi:DNA polymerase III subunit gamma/tau